MCTCHAKLSHEETRVGPATAELRHEHDVILRALAVLERVAERLAADRPVDAEAVATLVDLCRTFADRCHHAKEEHTLFPVLEAKGLGSPLQVFLDDHEEGRRLLTTLADATLATQRAAAARRYVALLRDHIERENEVLFPMAERVLTLDDHDELVQRFEAIEREVVGPGVHDRLLAVLDRLERTFP